MDVKGYSLINEEKVDRVLNGRPSSTGVATGGIIKADGTFDEDRLIAEYDRIGGCIMRGADKVKNGSFWDFANKRARKEPEVYFEFRINGRVIEVKEGEATPLVVQAFKQGLAEQQEEEEAKEEKKRTRRKTK